MKEEVRQSALGEADLPAILHKTWQAENPDFPLCRIRQTSACHCGSPSGLPTNCGAPFSTLPKSLTVHLSARSPVLTCLYPIAWEQNDFDGNLMGTRGILMGIVQELDENKRILMGTRGI
jgi:hypothetical protein